MARIASIQSVIADRPGRDIPELIWEICEDVIALVNGGIQIWRGQPEPDEEYMFKTTLRIDGQLRQNGDKVVLADEAEIHRLNEMLKMHVGGVLGRAKRDPALGCNIRVSIDSSHGETSLEVSF